MIPPFVRPVSGGQVPGQLASASAWGQPGGAGPYDPTHGYESPAPPVGPPVSMPGVPPQGAPPQMNPGAPPAMRQPHTPMSGSHQMQPVPQQAQRPHGGMQRGGQNQQAMEQMQSQIALQHLKGGRQGGNGPAPMGPMRR